MHVDIKEEPQFNEDFDVDFDQSEYLLKIFLEPWHTAVLHNGGNDPHKRQSQLWDQIACQSKTG